jgi:hypothetical protein
MGPGFEKAVKKTGAHINEFQADSHISFDFPRSSSVLPDPGARAASIDEKVDEIIGIVPWIMEQISGSKKREDGIEVSWREKGKEHIEFFSYQDIIDMKINAIDLLENPRFYLVDPKKRRIHATSRGCCET